MNTTSERYEPNGPPDENGTQTFTLKPQLAGVLVGKFEGLLMICGASIIGAILWAISPALAVIWVGGFALLGGLKDHFGWRSEVRQISVSKPAHSTLPDKSTNDGDT